MVITAGGGVQPDMRAASWMLALILMLAPLGLAQEGSGSSSSSSSSTSSSPSPAPGPCADEDDQEDREECQRKLREDCREHPDEARCRGAGNGTPPAPAPERCQEADDDEGAERCEREVRKLEERRQWITFQVDAPNATLLDYTIAGLLALEQVVLDLDEGNLSIERQGATVHVRDGDAELRLHDEPNGLIRFKGDDGNVTLVFPANASVVLGEHGARIAYPGGREGHLVADNATWYANATVHLQGFFAFHVPAEGAPAQERAEDPEVEEVQERKQDAIERGRIGAEVHLKPRVTRGGAVSSAMAVPDNESVQILAYDDVEVEVELPDDEADADAPVRVVVSSELDEGRTIVLNLDEALLASTDPDHLELRYFDLHNQTDGTVLETEVIFLAASSLQDVLEPTDDGGQPEFWVVEDANGVQVLVSVPHWSAHAITVASIATALAAPSVVVGIVAGIAATTTLGALLMWPRRRDDEL